MPFIPATRKRTLAKPQEDQLQWNLTKGHYKRQCREIPYPRKHSKAALTTEFIANKFVQFLFNTREENVKLDQLAVDIASLYQSVAFSSVQFNKIISEQAISTVRLLEYYYKLFTRLKVLALTLSSILQHVKNLDEAIVELISHDEYIAAAYIPHLTDEKLNEFFEIDGKQLTNWSSFMKISNARRLHIILEHHASTSSPDQLKNIMIRLMSFHKVQPKTSDESLSKCYYRQLRSVKEFLFGSKHTQTKQYDSFLAKKPVFLLISSWFFEFNSKSNIIFTDFISQIVSVGSSLENGSEVMDISVLLYSYFTACKDINTTEEGVLHIFDIIGAINNAVKQSLERDDQNDLCTILAIAQIALEHMHTSVGYTYASWFESLFIKRSSTILDKRMSTVFIKTLQQMILYEIPSVLQIHGRALLDCTTIPNSQLYVSSARKRLLELGVDRHLKSYPISLKTPLRLDIITDDNSGEGDEVGEIIQQFMQKDNTVPVSLLHAHVFKKQWFMSTFLPTLLDWKGRNVEARDKLIIALRKMNKVPDNLYKSFVQQQKQKKIA